MASSTYPTPRVPRSSVGMAAMAGGVGWGNQKFQRARAILRSTPCIHHSPTWFQRRCQVVMHWTTHPEVRGCLGGGSQPTRESACKSTAERGG